MPAPFTYEYDPLGTNPDNLIVAELRAVSPPVDPKKANYFVPLCAPFFKTGFALRTGPLPNSPLLVEGTDYIFTHRFVEASQSLGRNVYGSIYFLNREYTGNVYATYQTLGGAYTLNDVGIVESLTNSLYAIRFVTWTQIAGLPAAFPPNPHPHDSDDLTGMSEVVAELHAMMLAIASGTGNLNTMNAILTQHLAAGANKHTPSQVGLGNLGNYSLATQEDVELLRTNKYMNPLMVHYAINRFNLGGNAVIDATDILKGIIRIATNVEALAGTADNLAITPATLDYVVGQLIDAISLANQIQPGDVYITTVPGRDPTTFLGYGTWERIAKDDFIKGYNPDRVGALTPLAHGGSGEIIIGVENLPSEPIPYKLPVREGGGGNPGHPGALERNALEDGEADLEIVLGEDEPIIIDPLHTVLAFWLRIT